MKTEKASEICFTLKGALDMRWLPVDIPDAAWKIASIIAYSLDEAYYRHVHICIRGSHLEATISNEYVNHIDTCLSACMDAFEALLGRNQEGYVQACHDSCRKLVRKDAYDSLYATYLKLTEELEGFGYRYKAEFEGGETPQSLKITVQLD